jgi:hypothetical protein
MFVHLLCKSDNLGVGDVFLLALGTPVLLIKSPKFRFSGEITSFTFGFVCLLELFFSETFAEHGSFVPVHESLNFSRILPSTNFLTDPKVAKKAMIPARMYPCITKKMQNVSSGQMRMPATNKSHIMRSLLVGRNCNVFAEGSRYLLENPLLR